MPANLDEYRVCGLFRVFSHSSKSLETSPEIAYFAGENGNKTATSICWACRAGKFSQENGSESGGARIATELGAPALAGAHRRKLLERRSLKANFASKSSVVVRETFGLR
ncbi:MAG: hypothetical protein ACI4QA_02585 [Candidatus Spyradosoma sp.]